MDLEPSTCFSFLDDSENDDLLDFLSSEEECEKPTIKNLGWSFSGYLPSSYEHWKKTQYEYEHCNYCCSNKSKTQIIEAISNTSCYSRYNMNCKSHLNCKSKVSFKLLGYPFQNITINVI